MQIVELAVNETENLQTLAEHTASASFSLILPAHIDDQSMKRTRIELKNALVALREAATPNHPIEPLAEHLRFLTELDNDLAFWKTQQQGLCLFGSPEDDTIWMVKTPFPVKTHIQLSEVWFLSPLQTVLHPQDHFWLLAITEEHVRLWQGNSFSLESRTLPEGAPQSLDDIELVIRQDKSLQSHPAGHGSHGSGQHPIMHGHTDTNRVEDSIQKKYCQAIDQALIPLLNELPLPLIVAADDQLLATFRKVTSYQHLVEEGISQFPDTLKEIELFDLALPIVARWYAPKTQSEKERARTAFSHQQALDELKISLEAAVTGRIGTLWLDSNAETWGTFDPETLTFNQHPAQEPGDEELYNYLAYLSHQTRADIRCLPTAELPFPGKEVLVELRF